MCHGGEVQDLLDYQWFAMIKFEKQSVFRIRKQTKTNCPLFLISCSVHIM